MILVLLQCKAKIPHTWNDMFLAARLVQTKTSPPLTLNATYFMSGRTQQLVCPYMVSGRSVAATRKILLPVKRLSFSGSGSTARILTSVYSCGPTPSPLLRSWSMHGCPSLGEKMV